MLNGLRGLAVMIVFASHASNICFQGAITGWGAGQLGVMLFFVLSGFLMGRLYINTPASAVAFRNFMVNRLARIYPMYLVVVVACVAINSAGAQLMAYPIKTAHDALLHLTFVRGYSVLWTIGPEVIFYGLFLLLWRSSQASKPAFLAIALALSLLAWFPMEIKPTNSLFALQGRLPYFLAGVVLGMESDQVLSIRLPRLWASLGFWLCLVLYVASFPQIIRLIVDVPRRLSGDPWSDPWSFPYYLVATVALFVTAILARPWVLTNKLAAFLGRISFSFYLVHFALLETAHSWLPTHPLRAIVLAFVATTVLASLTYALIEIPARRGIRRFGGDRARSVAALPA